MDGRVQAVAACWSILNGKLIERMRLDRTGLDSRPSRPAKPYDPLLDRIGGSNGQFRGLINDKRTRVQLLNREFRAWPASTSSLGLSSKELSEKKFAASVPTITLA